MYPLLSSSLCFYLFSLLVDASFFFLFFCFLVPLPLVTLIWVPDYRLKIVILCFFPLLLISSLCLCFIVVIYRHSSVIRFSSPLFLLLLLFGAMCCSCLPPLLLFMSASSSTLSCYLPHLLGTVGFVLTFGSLFVKTQRSVFILSGLLPSLVQAFCTCFLSFGFPRFSLSTLALHTFWVHLSFSFGFALASLRLPSSCCCCVILLHQTRQPLQYC